MGGGIGDSIGRIYVGEVAHKRARPKRHSLRYRVFSLLVDLDALDQLNARLKLLSLGRFNLFSLYEKDFGPRDGSSLAAFVRHKATAAGVSEIARIEMLAYPRMLGYAFNPITVYFCKDALGKMVFVLYEVRNTFGEHHFYPTRIDCDQAVLTHEHDKAFYVSPFNTLEGRYRFSLRPPGEKVFVGIALSDDDGGLLTAYFSGEQRPLDDWTLLKLALEYPLLTTKVVVGIHWEAFKLWVKGVPLTLGFRRRLRRGEPVRR